ncbi:hypothetical protein LXL04_007302 [Taraxacum kok-saghyz]
MIYRNSTTTFNNWCCRIYYVKLFHMYLFILIISLEIYGCFRAVTKFKLNKTNKASFSPTVWSFPKCNQQEGDWSCGYYVMCWMHEFQLEGLPYSDEQLERRVNSWTINELMTYNMEKKTTDGRVQFRQKGKMVLYSIQKVTFTLFFMENMLDSKNFLGLMR